MKAGGGTRLCWGAAVLMLIMIAIPRPARCGRNLLNNGDFLRGSGDSVDGWRTDAWILTPGTTNYHWIAPHRAALGEVEIITDRDNDARWVQGLSLAPGWFHVSAEVRTRGVLQFFTGASVSVLEDGIMSEDVRGTSDWTPIGFYLRVGPRGADVDVALRLGGYMNLTRGQAWFRHAKVVRVLRPPPDAARVFDLDAIRKGESAGPIGHRWTLVATFVALGFAAVIGWRMMVEPPLPQESADRVRGRKRA